MHGVPPQFAQGRDNGFIGRNHFEAEKIILRHAVADHQQATVVVGNDPDDLTTALSAKVDRQKETCGCSGIMSNQQHRTLSAS